jgi:hypothetical protein
LLPARQATQALQRFVEPAIRLGLTLTLDRLILVPELVGLQLEEVGQLLGARCPAPAGATGVPQAHLHLTVGRFGAHQVLQGPLLGR